MSRLSLTKVFLVTCLSVTPSFADYKFVEVAEIPVERLIKNLQPKPGEAGDARATLNLARAHAMAFSLRKETVPVRALAQHDLWFGYEPALVPFRDIQATDDKERLKAAQLHLEEALKLYETWIAKNPADLQALLGYGWLLTHTQKKTQAVAVLRHVLEKAWEKEKDLKSAGRGQTFTGEGSAYLLPLLDPDKDKDEIARLQERMAIVSKLPRSITPIAVPLRAGLRAADLENRHASVAFDADGSGLQKKWTWTTQQGAWLVYDPQGAGKITSALQWFGNVTFWMFWDNGYEALAALDDNADGRLAGAELAGLALWHDANSNGISEPGEVRPLAAWQVTELSCRFERDPAHPERIVWSPAGVTYADGSTRPTFDLLLHPAR